MPEQPRSAGAVSEFAFADGVAGPRKQPTQGRSKQTVAAILEATFRVLDEGGELTTTRVAEVAGVSVGTLYQYFPNRDALINALLADHLEAAIAAVERECEAVVGLPKAQAIERVVRAFLGAKAERVANAKIMNKAFGIGMLDERPLVKVASQRAHVALAKLLAHYEDDAAAAKAQLGCDALEGIARGTLTDPDRYTDPAWVDQVVRMIVAGL
ncbi:MAG: TetR/AcrR family transcriptional regulator [Kofleriaceae bacterium]